jgi:starch synthase
MYMIVHLTSEVAPFYKRGGLGDVVGALPKYLADKHKNAVISFFYEGKMKAADFAQKDDVVITIQSVAYTFLVYHKQIDNVDFYFLNMADTHLLADMEFGDSNIAGEDGEKPYRSSIPFVIYLYFAKAALQLIVDLELAPEFLICHDWHVCGCFAFPAMIAGLNNETVCASILLIHNYEHQGEVFPDAFYLVGAEIYAEFAPLFKQYGSATLLSLGLKNADYVATVSATYADELMQGTASHPGLRFLNSIKRGKIFALPNGIDAGIWSPETSPYLAHNYNSISVIAQKKKAKAEIRQLLSFTSSENPVVLMMARLTEQKGINIIASLWEEEAMAMQRIKELLDTGIDLVVCGRPAGGVSGPVHKRFSAAAANFPGRFSYVPDYSEQVAHKLLAGCDAILCPSVFEPCGLVQIYGMAFGTVPVVRPVGGLKDTVIPHSECENSSTGFYIDAFTHASLLATLSTVVDIFKTQHDTWQQIVQRGMKQDYSWEHTRRHYFEMFATIRKNLEKQRLKAFV